MAGPWLPGTEDGEGLTTARTMLIAVRRPDEPDEGGPGTDLSLRELERLAEADGLTVVGTLVQSRGRPDPATYLGSGKVGELAGEVDRSGATVVIADGEPTPRRPATCRTGPGCGWWTGAR